jgi:hypothetical protein
MLYIHPLQNSFRWAHNKAFQGLTALSNKQVKNSGINDPLTNWIEKWFGKWKRVMISILASLLVLAAMALIGCCVIPSIWGLILRNCPN